MIEGIARRSKDGLKAKKAPIDPYSCLVNVRAMLNGVIMDC